MQLPVKVTNALGKTSLILKKHAPDILLGLGLVGMVGVAVEAVKAGKKHEQVRERVERTIHHEVENLNASMDMNSVEYKQELGKVYIQAGMSWAKLYGPMVALQTASFVALVAAHMQNKKRIGSLVAAYSVVDQAFKSYRGRVVEKLGEEKDAEFMYGKPERRTYEELDENGNTQKVKGKKYKLQGASAYAAYFDEYSLVYRRDPALNQFALLAIQSMMNDKLQAEGHVFLNEVWDELGIPRTPEGQLVGWVKDIEGREADGYIDFGLYSPMNEDFMRGLDDVAIIDPNVDGNVLDLF